MRAGSCCDDVSSILFESCVDSVEAAMAAEHGGADRLELCANLDVGGTTPDADLIRRVVASVAIPVFTMVRSRAGDFCYSPDELRVMIHEIAIAKTSGAGGIVFGALRRNGTIDAGAMRRLIDAARPLPVTCHRAIDRSRDLVEALDALVELGVDRMLTSGGAPTAIEGAEMITTLAARAGDALIVMAGGGVRAHNAVELVRRTHVREIHAHVNEHPLPAM